MTVTHQSYRITLDERGAVCSLVAHGKEMIVRRLPLFAFRLGVGPDAPTVTSDQALDVTVQQLEGQAAFTYHYQELTFTVTVAFDRQVAFSFRFSNHTGTPIEWVDIPQIALPNDLVARGGSGRLLMNINEGLLLENLAAKEAFAPYAHKAPEYPSQGLYCVFPAVVQSQFLAYYDDIAGLYIAATDEDRSFKGVDFAPLGEEAIQPFFRLFPGIKADQTDFSLPYQVVLEPFHGDWYTAAELYRSWLEAHRPRGLRKVAGNRELPTWYTDAPLVVTYPVQGAFDTDEMVSNRLFPYSNALPHLDRIADKTGSRIMALLMHWEGTAPWAPPYVWPPVGGEEMLRDFCDALHERRFLLGVYCSGISYTLHSNLNDYNAEERYRAEKIDRIVCMPPHSDQPTSLICQAQRKSYDMCISQPFTKQVILNEVEKIVSTGVDYIQVLDQNHGGTPYLCYSSRHKHPPLPGGWIVSHMTSLLRRLTALTKGTALLGCESGAAEPYLPYLNLSDNRYNLNYYVGHPVPLYAYLYHEYAYNFTGNGVCSSEVHDHRRSPDSFLMRLAYGCLAGDLMTLVINQDGHIMWSWCDRNTEYLPCEEAVLDFVRIATAYKREVGKPYLTFGRMVRPCPVESERVGMYSTFSNNPTYHPAVLTTAYVAKDGSMAQFLATYRTQEESCSIDLTGTDGAELVDETGEILAVLPADKVPLTLPPHSLRMLTIKKACAKTGKLP